MLLDLGDDITMEKATKICRSAELTKKYYEHDNGPQASVQYTSTIPVQGQPWFQQQQFPHNQQPYAAQQQPYAAQQQPYAAQQQQFPCMQQPYTAQYQQFQQVQQPYIGQQQQPV